MRMFVNAILLSTAVGFTFTAGAAQAHQECVSIVNAETDPYELVDVAHVVFSAVDAHAGKVDLYSFYAGELFNGTWEAIAGGHIIALTMNVKFVAQASQHGENAKNSNVNDATSGKLVGLVHMDSEKNGTLTLTLPNTKVLAFNLECKEVANVPKKP